jgi:cytochrome c-type biogenesis protein CcmH/NrfG
MFKGLLFLLRTSRTPALFLSLLLSLVPASYSQKAIPARKPTAPSPFAEGQMLLEQGSIAEAKAKIQEQLALHPNSVEGYNLLGIACTNEKDYHCALDAFQHALKLAPGSAKTRTNLGNVYVAQAKLDFA